METRDEIRSRMLLDVAKAWNIHEPELDPNAFDPVLALLIGACASELEKIGHEINNSRQRILDRLVNTLTPDVLNGPTPAHGVVQAIPVEPVFELEPIHQFYTHTGSKKEFDVHLAPAEKTVLTRMQVRYQAAGGKLTNALTRKPESTVTQSNTSLPSNILWLGIEIDARLQPEQLLQFQFFFNWKNDAQLKTLLAQLPFSQWFANKEPLAVHRENARREVTELKEIQSLFAREFSPVERARAAVQACYNPHFLTVSTPRSDWSSLLQIYPPELEAHFPLTDLARLEDRLLWLKVELPVSLSEETLMRTECALNCFPVLNLKFLKENYNVLDYLHIIPLRCESQFFDVHRVYNASEKEYHATPLTNLRNYQSGTYVLRRSGAGTLDQRGASQLLREMIDLLRDESAAFSAHSYDFLQSKIRTLYQEINDLEQHLREKKSTSGTQPYLFVRGERKNENIWVEYWATDGDLANQIIAGTKLDLYTSIGLQRDSITLMTPTTGGRNSLSPSESFFEYKKALLSRDRIVTREDIRTFCFATLQGRLEDLVIQNGVAIGALANQGLMRTVEVVLTPVDPNFDEKAWEALCNDLEITLNARSTGVLPIRLRVSKKNS